MSIAEKLFFSAIITVKELSIFHLALVLLAIVFVWQMLRIWSKPAPAKNPMSKDYLRDPEPLVLEKEKRDAVLKNGFASKKIPENLDAVVIGSGIGGLTTAALMAKAGKKVLVLEQHDQAGGCCHTFTEKGFEFDVGIHYIGKMTGQEMGKVLIDQLTDAQLEWVPIDDNFDTVILGDLDKQPRKVPIYGKGPDYFKKHLVELFPHEEKGINKFMTLLKKSKKSFSGFILLKSLPTWFANILIKTGLIHYVTDFFKYAEKSVADVVDEFIVDKDLKAVLAYSFGDYGTVPSKAPFIMQTALFNHFLNGAFYPRGGASEIAFHIIPVIQRAGGKVLVRAPVTNILVNDDGKAIGVRVHKGGEDYDIMAPQVISGAGIYNTYDRLIPPQLRELPDIQKALSCVQHGPGAMSVFVGLDGTKEELGVQAKNYWVYTSNEFDKITQDYMALSAEETGTKDIPLLFISFPSAKDPTWDQRFPGKTTCAIITLATYEWFAKWDGNRVGKRGDDYEAVKNRIADRMWQQTCKIFPQLKDRRVYFDVGSPVTNNYYIGSSRGEIYGVDHNLGRFTPESVTTLRPKTPIPGLILTGQDVFTCGFSGGMYGGLLAASEALNRNCLIDLMKFMAMMKSDAKKKSA